MFDNGVISDLQRSVAEVIMAPADLATPAQSCDAIRVVQSAQDALDAVKAAHLANLEQTRGYENEAYSSLTAWARRELRLSAKEARTLVSAGHTLKLLPAVRASAAAGRIRLSHVKEFTYGLRHIGSKTVQSNEKWLLDVAESCDAQELHQVLRKLREAVYPDSLDRAWGKGMDREDVSLNKVPDGWHLTGFLGIITGAKLKTVLNALSAPRTRDDKRPASERRVDALDAMLTSELEHGLPTDLGIRPQLNVIVELSRFLDDLGKARLPAIELTGFGPIGPKLASFFVCNSAVTGILTDGLVGTENPQPHILDLGRASRLADLKQRKAVIIGQHGSCAAPGCTNTHLEIHHVTWWSHGGATDLDNLIGLCSRCHHLVHRELLTVRRDPEGGFIFGDLRRVNRSAIRKVQFPSTVGRAETQLTRLLINERRRVIPRRECEYTGTHADRSPPVGAVPRRC